MIYKLLKHAFMYYTKNDKPLPLFICILLPSYRILYYSACAKLLAVLINFSEIILLKLSLPTYTVNLSLPDRWAEPIVLA